MLLQAKKELQEKQQESLLENDALAVFLLTIPRGFVRKTDKFDKIISEMKDKKITSE